MRESDSGKKKGKSRQAKAHKGQKASAVTKPAPGQSRFQQRSEVATTFGPSAAALGNPYTGKPNRTSLLTAGGRYKTDSTTTPTTEPKPDTTKTPASKSPDKVTKKEAMLGKRYAGLVRKAHVTVNKDMTTKQRKDIVKAREQLSAMRKKLAAKGYGKTIETKNGGVGGSGIYRSLTGKKGSTISKHLKKKPKAGK